MSKVIAVIAALSAAAIFVGGVSANNPDAGTIVASGFKCAIYDGSGSIYFTRNSTLTEYQHKAVVRCDGNNGVGARGPSVPFYFNIGNKSAVCGMRRDGFTADWSDKVGYNGSSQLTCTKALPLATDDTGTSDDDAGLTE